MNAGGFRAMRARMAAALAMGHLVRYAQSGDPQELHRAIAAGRRALALTSEDDPPLPRTPLSAR
ncbi:hypothetical protein GCM10018965_017560 [Nonomuraea roseola]